MRRLALLVALGACHGGAARSGKALEPLRTAVVHRGDVTERLVLTGDLHAVSSEELRVPRTDAWQLPIRWMAEDGAPVKAGDKVLEFDNSAFTQNLATQRIAVIEAQMSFAEYADVSALEALEKDFELQTQQIGLSKAKVLAEVPADLLPARTAQERQLERKRAEVALDKAMKELASARQAASLERQVKQIELDKTRRGIEAAEKSIGELVLKAPRDGILVIGEHPWEGRKFQVGDEVQPGWTIVSLPDFAQGMEVRADLNDVDDGKLSVGMAGTCTLDAYPADAVPCTVKDLMPVANAKSRESLRRSFAVVLALSRTDNDRYRPGMSVKVELRRPPVANALVVPRGAVVFDPKATRVRLAAGELRDVTLGVCDAQGCVVEQGVADGERVAIGGAP